MERSIFEYRLIHGHGGQKLAGKIKTCLSKMYQLNVQLVNIESEGGLASPLPRLRDPSLTPRHAGRNGLRLLNNKTGIIFLLTPALRDILTKLDEERNILTGYLASSCRNVSINCMRTMTSKKLGSWLADIFSNSIGNWRWINLDNTLDAFWNCISGLAALTYDFVEEGEKEDLAHILSTLMPKCRLLNKSAVLAGENVFLLLETDDVQEDTLTVQLKNGHLISANKIADQLYQFEAPECQAKSAEVDIFSSDGASLGVSVIEYKQQQSPNQRLMGSMLLNASNSIGVLYKAISSVSQREDVDQELCDWLKRKRVSEDPDAERFKHWHECMLSGIASQNQINREFPTLLHLVAKFNLLNTANQLLGMRDTKRALNAQNNLGLTPEELAQKLGHTELAQLLAAEMQDDDLFNTSFSDDDVGDDEGWKEAADARFVTNKGQESGSSVGYVQPNAWLPKETGVNVTTEVVGTETKRNIAAGVDSAGNPQPGCPAPKENPYLQTTGQEIKYLSKFDSLGRSCPRNLNFFNMTPCVLTSNNAPNLNGFPSGEAECQGARELYTRPAALHRPRTSQASRLSGSPPLHPPLSPHHTTEPSYTDTNPSIQSFGRPRVGSVPTIVPLSQSSVSVRQESHSRSSLPSYRNFATQAKPLDTLDPVTQTLPKTLNNSPNQQMTPPKPHASYSMGTFPEEEEVRNKVWSWPLSQRVSNIVEQANAGMTSPGSGKKEMTQNLLGNGYIGYDPLYVRPTDNENETGERIYETIEDVMPIYGPSKV